MVLHLDVAPISRPREYDRPKDKPIDPKDNVDNLQGSSLVIRASHGNRKYASIPLTMGNQLTVIPVILL